MSGSHQFYWECSSYDCDLPLAECVGSRSVAASYEARCYSRNTGCLDRKIVFMARQKKLPAKFEVHHPFFFTRFIQSELLTSLKIQYFLIYAKFKKWQKFPEKYHFSHLNLLARWRITNPTWKIYYSKIQLHQTWQPCPIRRPPKGPSQASTTNSLRE